jgi:hypothetical protein
MMRPKLRRSAAGSVIGALGLEAGGRFLLGKAVGKAGGGIAFHV